MSGISAATIEMLLRRGSRPWLEYYQQEIVPRKRFNDRFLVGRRNDDVQEYRMVIEELFTLLSMEMNKSDTDVLSASSFDGHTFDAQTESKLAEFQLQLRKLLLFPASAAALARGSRKRNQVSVRGTVAAPERGAGPFF